MEPREGEKQIGGASPATRAFVALGVTAALTAAVSLIFGMRAYDWLKAVHVIAVISWMAGMLYLPRLFIYHSQVAPGSETSELFKVMERRLLRIIMNPAMVLSWVIGLWLAWQAGWFKAPWFHAKLLLVILLSAVHGHHSKSVRLFAEDKNTISTRHWRILNEIPAVLMIGIVVLVIVKPF